MDRRFLLRSCGFGAALIATSLLGACMRTIHRVENRSFNGAADLEQRAAQIIAAAEDRNWRVLERARGRVRLTYAYTEHRVTLDVLFSETQFSFQYVNSAGLSYDGTQVHRAYNHWVEDLERRILAEGATS